MKLEYRVIKSKDGNSYNVQSRECRTLFDISWGLYVENFKTPEQAIDYIEKQIREIQWYNNPEVMWETTYDDGK